MQQWCCHCLWLMKAWPCIATSDQTTLTTSASNMPYTTQTATAGQAQSQTHQSSCYGLQHIDCRTSTSTEVLQWCCQCVWLMKAWPCRATSDQTTLNTSASNMPYTTPPGTARQAQSQTHQSSCYGLQHIDCRTSTSTEVLQWCCQCAWLTRVWPWRVASRTASRTRCCAACASWSTPASSLWR